MSVPFWLPLLAACHPTYVSPEEAPVAPGTAPADYTDAATAADVPLEILLALSRAETRFQMVKGEVEFDGQEPAYGVMALRSPWLEHGADLAGLDAELVRTERSANLAAAAWLLAEWAAEEGVPVGADLGAWAPVVARWSGIADDEEAVAEYVHHEVYGALAEGLALEGYELAPMKIEPEWPTPAIDSMRARDLSAIWSPSPNYNSRNGISVELVVIHTCEGSYSGCWSWLTNSASGVSAHYVVNDNGTEVRALVDETNRAWHVSATYDCDLNGRTDCAHDGTSSNSITVGIEHAGYASQSTWDAGLLQRSAELTCGITERNDIVRDSYHIVAHGLLQPYNRVDPGPNWPWTDYLSRVNAACGDTGAPPEPEPGTPVETGESFIIDSNNASNDMAKFYMEVSGDWWASTNVSGYYNTGYWVSATGPIADPASFWFNTSEDACWQVEGWWTAGTDRPSSAAFIGWDPGDVEVGRATVSQKINGGKWNHLGYWNFGTGWNRVLLSRWTTAGSYVVADAIRLSPSTSCP